MTLAGMDYVWRGLAIWLVIILAESVHGTARVLVLQPRVGDFRARQIAFFTGMVLILAIAMLFIRWIRACGAGQLLRVGLLWMAMTLLFEISLGRFVMGYSWERLLSDYDLSKGGLMGFGLLFLVFAPRLAARLRGEA
ncbi:MAG: hypothetical protein ACKVX9_17935 [Blastocatellia bacterium]